MPPLKAARMPNRMKATAMDRKVNIVLAGRRHSPAHISGRYFMRRPEIPSTPEHDATDGQRKPRDKALVLFVIWQARQSRSTGGTVLPGLRIFFGSKAAFIARIASSSSCDL